VRTHRLFQEDLGNVGERLPLTAENVRIARSVLRLRNGDRVQLMNGKGGLSVAELLEAGRQRGTVLILDQTVASAVWPSLTLLQGLPKGDKSSWIVQKVVECGVERILFVDTEHTVPKRPEGAKRWTRIAVEALRQSGNPFLPEIVGPLPLSEGIAKIKSELLLMLDETEKSRRMRDFAGEKIPSSIALAVGPEGGWSSGDREILRQAGFRSAQLGPYVLRTETAALAAVAAARAIWG